MSNKVLITNSQKAVKVPSGLRILIRRACNAVLEYEHFDEPAEISVTFVDNAAIAELNNQYRNKPMPTDVLSFPLGENGCENDGAIAKIMSFSHCRRGQHGADTLCVRIAGTYGLDQILNGFNISQTDARGWSGRKKSRRRG